MHVDLEVWGVLFAFVLFLLLIKTLGSLVKSLIVPYLTTQLHEITKEQSELFDKEKLVSSALSKIENQRKQQGNMFVLLEKKVQVWHDKKMVSLQQEQLFGRILVEKIEKKRLLQEKNFIATKTIQDALPRIIENVEQQLKSGYKQDAADLSQCVYRFVQVLKQGLNHD